jgi:hypothetical protein
MGSTVAPAARSESMRGGVDQDVSTVDQHDHLVNRCWRGILNKRSQYLPLLSAGLGCLRRAMRRRTPASSAAAGRCSPSNSLAGLPWHEFIRRVAAAEAVAEADAEAEADAIVRAHLLYYGCPPSSAHPRERTRLAALMNRLAAQMRTLRRASRRREDWTPLLDVAEPSRRTPRAR